MRQTPRIGKLLIPRMCRVMSYIRSILLSTGFVIILFLIISTHHISSYNISNMEESNEFTTGTEISDLTNDTRSQKTIRTSSTSGTGSVVTKKKGNKWDTPRNLGNPPHRVNSFKGDHSELSGKVFLKEPLQAAKYDEAHKVILNCTGIKYDHRMYKAFEYKNRTKGTKPARQAQGPHD